MPPRVAILGWGSLIWEGSAFDKWHDDWRYDGPILKLEFSRVSASRLNALTLVIDRDNGQPNRVAWCLSRRDDSVLTHADLQSREGTTARNIGRILLAQLDLSPTDQSAADIAAWARTQALDAVVWTRLSSNFESATRVPFSIENAQHTSERPSPEKPRPRNIYRKPPSSSTRLCAQQCRRRNGFWTTSRKASETHASGKKNQKNQRTAKKHA